MDAISAEQKDQTFQIAATFWGRGLAALERFLFVVPVIVIFGAIFFLPDYLGRYREQEPVPGLLLGSVVAIALFIGLITSLARFTHSEVWVIDLDEDMLIYQSKRVFRDFEQTGIDLDRLERFHLISRRAPRSSGLFIEMSDEQKERLFEFRAGAPSFERAADNLESFIDEHNLDIAVTREGE